MPASEKRSLMYLFDSAHRGSGRNPGATTRVIPLCTISPAQTLQGAAGQVYIVQPVRSRVAKSRAFASACTIILYFFSRSTILSGESVTPLGSPLNPNETTRSSWSTTTAPTLVLGSLLHCEMCAASSRNLLSHFFPRSRSDPLIQFVPRVN